jgi:hypothetical protein
MKKQMKHLEHTLATYVYSHCNMCNILTYFCDIQMKDMQYPDKTSKTLETYACNMRFQRNVTLQLGGREARRYGQRQRMEFAGAAAAWETR